MHRSSLKQTIIAIVLLPLVGCASHIQLGGKTRAGSSSNQGEDRLSSEAPTVAKKTQGMHELSGLLDLFLDSSSGKAWVRLPAPTPDEHGRLVHASLLHVEGLATGLGSNPVGLDRGQLGGPQVVTFRRVGDLIVLEAPNLSYRADSPDPHERRAVTESFASSVLWAGEVAAEDPDGAVLVDLTGFLMQDAHGVVGTLANTGQGSFSVDKERSFLELDQCHAFPDNVEFAVRLTFGGSKPGSQVRSTTPDPKAISLQAHHSFIRRPDGGYRPRVADLRSGSFAVSYRDYAADLDQPVDVRLAVRHRLQKTDPTAASSPVIEPIVYYVDRGAPEPVREALVEGASWWAEAFAAAGFEDAFRVELLPEGAHPLDVRYNVIQWVHRSTRGWSYGNALADPLTGEIIKGHVSLGSLRVRQDRLLFEGLLGTAATGTGTADDPVQLSLARIRQLAAHEVGHTLGFSHNFCASTYGGRASVMDYPAPLLHVTDQGEIDSSDAYGIGVGSWDRVAVNWLYGDAPAGEDERVWLDGVLAQAEKDGLRYLSDSDARSAGTAHPYAHLWDNFSDPVDGLENALAVRAVALSRFGRGNLADGQPQAHLEEVFTPVYFHHRYQVDAVAKMVGGVDYTHALAGDGRALGEPVSRQNQMRALEALLGCLDPAKLDVPESILQLLPPRPPGQGRNRELAPSATGPTFDPLGLARLQCAQVVADLLHPERAARLVDQNRRSAALPSLEAVLNDLIAHVFAGHPDEGPRRAELRHVAQTAVVRGITALAADSRATDGVRSRARAALRSWLREPAPGGAPDAARLPHLRYLAAEVGRFLERPAQPAAPSAPAPDLPPGGPIGAAAWGPEWGACSAGN